MRLLVLGFILLASTPLFAQTSVLSPVSLRETSQFEALAKLTQETDKLALTDMALEPLAPNDSLIPKRKFMSTAIYKNGRRLSTVAVMRTLWPKPKYLRQYTWGTILKPIGPLVSLSGVWLGYMGIKGYESTAMVKGIKTPTDYYPKDVQVSYTHRNLPQLLAGVGLFISGICLVELSNDIVAKSVNGYNSKLRKPKKVVLLENARFGITPGGNLGLSARF
ncbi:hypothetical protein GCM10028805_61380 [Spirosoma harenae]